MTAINNLYFNVLTPLWNALKCAFRGEWLAARLATEYGWDNLFPEYDGGEFHVLSTGEHHHWGWNFFKPPLKQYRIYTYLSPDFGGSFPAYGRHFDIVVYFGRGELVLSFLWGTK